MQEKVDLAIEKARYMPSELSDAEVEVRDISTNPYWEKKYGLVIPVLTVNRPGSEDEVSYSCCYSHNNCHENFMVLYEFSRSSVSNGLISQVCSHDPFKKLKVR